MENPRDINYRPPLDIRKVRSNAIRTLEAEIPKTSARLEGARNLLTQIQKSYTGDPALLDKLAALVIEPLEHSIQDATKQLEDLHALQRASDGEKQIP